MRETGTGQQVAQLHDMMMMMMMKKDKLLFGWLIGWLVGRSDGWLLG
jgi:hypothetical protein